MKCERYEIFEFLLDENKINIRSIDSQKDGYICFNNQFKILKKIFPLTFLIIFLFNVAGYFIAFKVEQFQIKSEIESEIKSGINTEYLTTITINKTDLATIQWTEFGKEMRYYDELYDVVRFSETANTITYYCINDSKEDSLFAILDNHINTHIATNNSQKSSNKMNNHVIKLYFLNKQQFAIEASESSTNLLPFNLIFITTILEKNTLPPEFV